MKTGVIAFCGSKYSGKSTSATIFKEFFKGETEELAFAGHLKKSCSIVFNIDMKYFLDPSLKEVELDNYINLTKDKIESIFKEFEVLNYNYDDHIRPHVGQVFYTPRSLLQYIGTEVLHPIDPLIHVKITMKNKDNNKLSIITDLRFTQEFDHLMSRNDFIPVYVNNHRAEESAKSDSHPSERQVLLFKDRCFNLNNNFDMQNLRDEIKSLINKYFGDNNG